MIQPTPTNLGEFKPLQHGLHSITLWVFRLPIHLVPKLGLSAKGGLQLQRFGRPKRGYGGVFFSSPKKKTGKIWPTKYQLPPISLSEFFCMYMMIWRFKKIWWRSGFLNPFLQHFEREEWSRCEQLLKPWKHPSSHPNGSNSHCQHRFFTK